MKNVLILITLVAAFWCLSDEQPNVLWLTSEDNSASWLACYGNPHSETPHIDRLAEEGFLYERCYANAPVCAPSRNTWITGVMALSMGTHPMRSKYGIPHDKIRLYPDYLNDRGIYTGNWKKTDYNFGGRPVSECWDNNSKKLDWKAMQANQPFFQVINFTESHESSAFKDIENTDHDPANTTLAVYHPDTPDMRKNYALYHDAVKRMDQRVGAALQKLEDLGMADDTIVIYNSDHGGVLPRSKRFLFQNSLHCPLVIRIPQKFKHLWPAEKPGSRVDRLVSFVDMPKTWLSIMGAEVPEVMQGRIFLGPDSEPEAEFHFAFRGRMDERVDNARAVVQGRHLYIRNYMPYVPWMQKVTYLWTMKASQVWAQTVHDGSADEIQSRFFAPKTWTEELYDMEKDPDNVTNLVDHPEYREILGSMRKNLRERQLEIDDAGLIPETEMALLAEKHNKTIYEIVRNRELYDVEALLNAADLALARDPSNITRLRTLLDSEDVGLRYWGIVGCFLLGDAKAGSKAMNDESHEVRGMAAWLLMRTGSREAAVACMSQMIEERSYALVSLMNIVDWMGDDGRDLMPAIRKLEFVEQVKKQFAYEIRMRDILLEKFGP